MGRSSVCPGLYVEEGISGRHMCLKVVVEGVGSIIEESMDEKEETQRKMK